MKLSQDMMYLLADVQATLADVLCYLDGKSEEPKEDLRESVKAMFDVVGDDLKNSTTPPVKETP